MEKDMVLAIKEFMRERTDQFQEGSEYVNHKKRRQWIPGTLMWSSMCIKIKYRLHGKYYTSCPYEVKFHRNEGLIARNYGMIYLSNEICFYRKIVPFLKQYGNVCELVPVFLGHYSVNSSYPNALGLSNFTIMLNSKKTYTRAKVGTALDFRHLQLLLQTLADFHACSFAAKAKNLTAFSDLAHTLREIDPAIAILNSETCKGQFKVALPAIRKTPRYIRYLKDRDEDEFLEYLRKRTLEYKPIDPTDETLVLCHGEVNIHNFLFSYDKEGYPRSVIIDGWGCCGLRSVGHDLGRVLIGCTDQPMREQHWKHLLYVYYSALQKTKVPIPSREQIFNSLTAHLISAYHAAVNFVPIYQALEKGELDRDDFTLLNVAQLISIGRMYTVQVELLKDMMTRMEILGHFAYTFEERCS